MRICFLRSPLHRSIDCPQSIADLRTLLRFSALLLRLYKRSSLSARCSFYWVSTSALRSPLHRLSAKDCGPTYRSRSPLRSVSLSLSFSIIPSPRLLQYGVCRVYNNAIPARLQLSVLYFAGVTIRYPIAQLQHRSGIYSFH